MRLISLASFDAGANSAGGEPSDREGGPCAEMGRDEALSTFALDIVALLFRRMRRGTSL